MMKILILMTFFLSTQAVAINYYRCDVKDDCIRTYGGCGRYLAVHKRYQELYEAKAHLADRTANCLPPSEKDKKRKFDGEISCLKNSCRLLLPKIVKKET